MPLMRYLQNIAQFQRKTVKKVTKRFTGTLKMNFEEVCRTCLGNKSLQPIFKNKEYYDRFSMAMLETTGLKVELNDDLPQNICIDCMAHINESLKFRVQCKESETKLLQMLSNENVDTLDCSDDGRPLKLLHEYKTETNTDNSNEESNSKENNINTNETSMDPENILDLDYKLHNNKEYVKEYNSDIKIEVTEVEYKKQSQRVICKICKKDLSVRSYDAHMSKRHPGADERKVKCEYCETYVLKGKLKRHTDMMHGERCSRCGFCKLEFPTKDDLIQHVTSCSGKKRRRKPNNAGKEISECDVCHKKMQKASLKMHQRIKHAGLGPVCDHCSRKFSNKFRLNEHLRSKHGYDKFKCSLAHCHFQSASTTAMTNHERRHRGEKPYVCEQCGATFHAAYLLTQHRQTHRTEKLLKCDVCPARFKANNSLHMHKMSCHGRAAHACPVCARAYKCRHYAVKHLRAVHRYTGPVPALPHLTQ